MMASFGKYNLSHPLETILLTKHLLNQSEVRVLGFLGQYNWEPIESGSQLPMRES
jgi:hypothetical protein